MYKKLHIHFVGIGGIGMSGIAEVLLNLGYPVSGSDIKRTATITRLCRLGAKISIGHHEKNVKDVDVMVVSSAINSSNPEVLVAHQKNIRVIQRAEMLAEIMRHAKYGIAVAGTHGKTTTTSLLASVLHQAKIDPTVIIGGRLNSLRSNAKLGRGDFMLAEADESDGSFLKLFPTICVVTNIDREHMDYYKNFDRCREAYVQFCDHLPFYGVAILCGENKEAVAVSKKIGTRHQLYGTSPKHDWNAQNIVYHGTSCEYDLYRQDHYVDHIFLNIPGQHNVLNSLAAIAVADEIGVKMGPIKQALKHFKGVGRRMEVLYKGQDLIVLDDYGHHPTEIRATLQAIRHAFRGRLVVLFQPHRYTRTKDLFQEFVCSFSLVDKLFITNIYAASESPLPGVTAKKLADKIRQKKQGEVVYVPHTPKIVGQILSQLKPGDIFLSLGAGDVSKIGRQIAKELKAGT